MQGLKSFIGNLLKIFNIEIRKIPHYEKNFWGWLVDYNIRTILDIGSYRGRFSLEINKFLPNAKIFAFEPLKESYQELLKNTRHIKCLEAFNIGLGNTNENTMIYKHDFTPASSLLQATPKNIEIFPYIGQSNKQNITLCRLDDFVISNNLTLTPEIFIKMDVQGFENKVINGGKNVFEKSRIIMCEVSFLPLYNEQASFDSLYELLSKIGFEFKGVIDRVLHPENGLPIYGDLLFIKK